MKCYPNGLLWSRGAADQDFTKRTETMKQTAFSVRLLLLGLKVTINDGTADTGGSSTTDHWKVLHSDCMCLYYKTTPRSSPHMRPNQILAMSSAVGLDSCSNLCVMFRYFSALPLHETAAVLTKSTRYTASVCMSSSCRPAPRPPLSANLCVHFPYQVCSMCTV